MSDDHFRRRLARSGRDYKSRELFEMAANAREGIPPAVSVAAAQIRDAEERGDFTTALTLRTEVKEKAVDLFRMARAQRRAEKRAANRAAREWSQP